MRKTLRSNNNKDYWQDRWNNLDADEIMLNQESYPLKNAINAIKYNEKIKKF